MPSLHFTSFGLKTCMMVTPHALGIRCVQALGGARAAFAVHTGKGGGSSPTEVLLETGDMLVSTAGPVVFSATTATEVESLGVYNEVMLPLPFHRQDENVASCNDRTAAGSLCDRCRRCIGARWTKQRTRRRRTWCVFLCARCRRRSPVTKGAVVQIFRGPKLQCLRGGSDWRGYMWSS